MIFDVCICMTGSGGYCFLALGTLYVSLVALSLGLCVRVEGVGLLEILGLSRPFPLFFRGGLGSRMYGDCRFGFHSTRGRVRSGISAKNIKFKSNALTIN